MYPYYDLSTLILYLAVGFFFAILIRLYNKYSNNRYLIIAGCLFILFSISRSVDYALGGMDSKSYELDFLYCLTPNHGIDIEPLFLYFTQVIRKFTASPIIYRFFCYSVISFGYFSFIKNFCPKESSSIPYIALIVPFILSFNTMRSSMAAALVLLGLVTLKKEKLFWTSIFFLSSIFVHRMSALFTPFILFYLIFKNGWIYKTKIRFVATIVSFVCLSVIIAQYLKRYIVLLGILEGADASYIMMNDEKSLFSATAYVVPLILLIGFVIISSYSKIYSSFPILTSIIIYDIIIYPASFILGMWRANEFLYVARLTMWGILIFNFLQRFSAQSRFIIRSIFLIAFLVWVINRINAVWEDAALMPYIINWLQ